MKLKIKQYASARRVFCLEISIHSVIWEESAIIEGMIGHTFMKRKSVLQLFWSFRCPSVLYFQKMFFIQKQLNADS